MKKEIEILWKLKDTWTMAMQKLSAATFVKEKKIVDYYLFDPLRKDLQPGKNLRLSKCLRIRESGSGSHLTFKHDHFEKDVWLYSDETESGVERADVILSLFKNLGFEILVLVDVHKIYFSAGHYEIALEKVKGLGNYIEVEYHSDKEITDIHAVKEEIRAYIQSLGIKIGEEENAGKPELLLRKKNKK
ncbi:MAG: class IV adenylate cyclase [Candidatus Parcubacteria bacterium]|nr:class IV adenylate cyclase [Candidatus Parcubacteria bacterium]